MITRFAPSPTGPLHLGHAYSALTVWQTAERMGGTALLRIEDTDSTRVRPEWEQGIYMDLRWLGLAWPTPVRRQSDHTDAYSAILQELIMRGLIYPCSCTRRQIIDAGAAHGADGMVYPGTCRGRSMDTALAGDALRLDVQRALAQIDHDMCYEDTVSDRQEWVTISTFDLVIKIGDPVLQRKDTGDPSYHLACVHDDGVQGITHVVRGADLQGLTPLHALLQTLLGLPTPIYHHHGLLMDERGKRLAKVDRAKALSKYVTEGATLDDIKVLIDFED